MAALAAIPVPRSGTSRTLFALACPAPQAPRYCLSFTAASLRPELAAVIARIHLEEGDWKRTKAAVLERNALQARTSSSGKRLESELRQRLQTLTPAQLKLLAKGSRDDRTAMAWLAVLKRIQLALEVVKEVLSEKFSGIDLVLRRSDLTDFYESCERRHPELQALSPSSQQKIRSTLLHMLREAGLLEGKASGDGSLGTVQRPVLTSQAQGLVASDDAGLLMGFLQPPNAAPANRRRNRTVKRKAA